MNKFIVLITALLLQGCASILSNSAYPVLIESNPAGAEFVINNINGIEVAHGQTPATVILESGAGYFKKADYTVQFFKPGFQSQTYRSTVISMAGIGATFLIPSAWCWSTRRPAQCGACL